MTSPNMTLDEVRDVMGELGGECVLIGGWASYLHLRTVALSHDVDTILDPLHNKDHAASVIGAKELTHLGKLSGEVNGNHVDLYVPHTSVLRDIPVEKLLPYQTIIDGIRVLIPEAHLLTKAACVLDDKRFNSDRAPKDCAEVRGLMELSDPAFTTALWSNVVRDNTVMMNTWNTLLNRVQSDVPKRVMKQGFADELREWKRAVESTATSLSDAYPVADAQRVMLLPDAQGRVVKFGLSNHTPSTVETLDEVEWTDSRSVRAGEGKRLLELAQRTHPVLRAVPDTIARDFAYVTNRCLLCGRELSDAQSLARGYGSDCADKVRQNSSLTE